METEVSTGNIGFRQLMKKEKLEAYPMKRVAAGAHLSTPRLFGINFGFFGN